MIVIDQETLEITEYLAQLTNNPPKQGIPTNLLEDFIHLASYVIEAEEQLAAKQEAAKTVCKLNYVVE